MHNLCKFRKIRQSLNHIVENKYVINTSGRYSLFNTATGLVLAAFIV